MEIRFCKKEDIQPVMHFLGKHWSKDHVLAKSRALMDWQHLGTQGRDYDFVACFEGDEVYGCLGFILTSRYDPALEINDTIWLTTWKARGDGPKGLGLRLLSFVNKHVPHRWIGTVGTNSTVATIYRALGYRTGTLSHHYVIHPTKEAFSLAQVPEGSARIHASDSASTPPTLRKLNAVELLSLEGATPDNVVPAKTPTYYINRFLENPFYSYEIFSIEGAEKIRGWLVTRVCEAEGSRALRIVDLHGDSEALAGVAQALHLLLEERDAEYADWYQQGHDDDAIRTSGFLTLESLDSDVVIPNYFEPFIRKNVSVNWAMKLSDGDRLVAFKADADQDRPSIMV